MLFLTLLALPLQAQQAPPALDFAFFQQYVQPIFLRQRAGHARCVSCHTHRIPPLQPLSAGAVTWNEEQSRKNFNAWKAFVKPGEPGKSRMLMHPLAASAGGDHFHAGGKHWNSQNDPEWQTLAAWVKGRTAKLTQSGVRVLQSNSAGDNIHIIDPATLQVTGVMEGTEVPHGLVVAPGGRRIYVTNEALVTLDVVDVATLQVSKRIPLSGRPNNLDVSPDGKYVYVGIRQGAGAVDVIDTASLRNAKTVPVKGEVHNVYVTPDGKHVVAGSIAASTISVLDAATNTLAWTLTLSAGIRPMAFTQNADGSTKDIIVQLSDFHGIALVDFQSRKEYRRVTIPDPPGIHKETEGLQGSPSHGLAITPDGKMLWATSKYYGAVAAFRLPSLEFVKLVPVGSHPDWLTIPPDGKHLYVAVAGDDTTVVVDNKTLEVVKTIPVGSVPKRITNGFLRVD
ncbi:MAG: beta-propeller fold lactonase family protein [Acidobacteria bacterium]|nr:beta-propeller fold lactonase family protein [Acidobacteriota bacterium]